MAAPSFDPFKQEFTLLLADGTPFNVSLVDLDEFNLYNVQTCINYGAQLGASILLLIVQVLLTKREKRGSPVFALNVLALSTNLVRSLLQCLYFTSGFSVAFAYFASDFSRVPRTDYAQSVAAAVLTLLLLIVLEASLVLQMEVVCATMKDTYRLIVTIVSGAVALLAIAFRFCLTVINIKSILAAENFFSWAWLAKDTEIITATSICFFCAIFGAKLGYALLERRKLGMTQFGPMKIIFIMGLQTMTIPAIFACLQFLPNCPELGSNVLTLVALSLPISSMWASSSLDGSPPSTAARAPKARGKLMYGSYASGSAQRCSGGDQAGHALTPSNRSLHTSTTQDSPLSSMAEKRSDIESQPSGIQVQQCVDVTSFPIASRSAGNRQGGCD